MSPDTAGDTQQRHRVLLVREWDVQTSGSGCCGRLGSETVGSLTGRIAPEEPYARNRAEMERFGAAYRALRDRYREDELDLTVVDPRNAIWLVPAIWRDARRRGLSPREALHQVFRGTATRAVICDGLVLTAGEAPDSGEVVAAVERDLAEYRPSPGREPAAERRARP